MVPTGCLVRLHMTRRLFDQMVVCDEWNMLIYLALLLAKAPTVQPRGGGNIFGVSLVIHPSIVYHFLPYLCRVLGWGGTLTLHPDIGRKVGLTLAKSPVHRQADIQTNNHAH